MIVQKVIVQFEVATDELDWQG